ncbi:ferric reductase like transmembrane component [Emericellopsis atlantica]|uniref:Ferric reductase like transmembrane component n=1 Tax=Emericellopsis atlantica TaxID=2614577 RepID=A0A9P7ZGM7_9HYPO|nr:ferric reductase like transmembrane component [Emericellopsis atlantica]KAG9251749.1 ferric reductase like transmembrane component [Emericellopsis atlantica]
MDFKRSHIQNFTLDTEVEHHWGYADRQTPCLTDPGSCEYLDAVYGAHDRGMIYVGVLWLTIAAVLSPRARRTSPSVPGGVVDVANLLTDCWRPIFGRTTRLQVLILATLTAYLTVWSFFGITYKHWITPVQDHPGVHNTRSGLGPWSDRVGVLAYALTPLSVLLGSRESLLSLITGVPYQHFNFLHRWLGYIIVVQGVLHTIGWCIIEIRLYQPQPDVAAEWIVQLYMIWGLVAMTILLLLYILTLPFVIRRTGYEFFRKSHYVLAMLHCFLTPSIILWGLDRCVRLLRTWLIHRKAINDKGGLFNPAQASVTRFPDHNDGDIVRLDLKHPHKPWSIGQHFYLCFTDGSIWQSHPFTPLNLPEQAADGTTQHSYIFRAKGGETKKVAEMLAETKRSTTGVILTGPYGANITRSLTSTDNVLCIAGGTGITYVLPVIMDISRRPVANRKVELVWLVRYRTDIDWIKPELDVLEGQDNGTELKIHIFTTRDTIDDADGPLTPLSDDRGSANDDEKKSSSSPRQQKLVTIRPGTAAATAGNSCHPDVKPIVQHFVHRTVSGPTKVYSSGPGRMMSGLREAIAGLNSGTRVWKGQQRHDVSLECDERLEY